MMLKTRLTWSASTMPSSGTPAARTASTSELLTWSGVRVTFSSYGRTAETSGRIDPELFTSIAPADSTRVVSACIRTQNRALIQPRGEHCEVLALGRSPKRRPTEHLTAHPEHRVAEKLRPVERHLSDRIDPLAGKHPHETDKHPGA